MNNTMKTFNERYLIGAGIEANGTPEVIAVLQGRRNHKMTQFDDFSFDADSIMTAIEDGKAGFTPIKVEELGRGDFYVDLSNATLSAEPTCNELYFNAVLNNVTVVYDQATDERDLIADPFKRKFKLKLAGYYNKLTDADGVVEEATEENTAPDTK